MSQRARRHLQRRSREAPLLLGLQALAPPRTALAALDSNIWGRGKLLNVSHHPPGIAFPIFCEDPGFAFGKRDGSHTLRRNASSNSVLPKFLEAS